jgi:tRNA(fMet)-specific endonuclease VapC
LKAKKTQVQLAAFNRFCTTSRILPITDQVIVQASDIYADLHHRGTLISDADILIASTAIVHNLVVVTNNEAHFKRIPGLTVENWLKA